MLSNFIQSENKRHMITRSRLQLSDQFIEQIFTMFKTWLHGTVDLGNTDDREEIVALLISYIEGCIVVGAYRQPALVRQSANCLKRLLLNRAIVK